MLRVAHVIQSVDAPAGGTSTAFLELFGALAERADLGVRAFTCRPGAGDPAKKIIGAAPAGRWVLAARAGRFLVSGPLGRRVANEAAAGGFDLLHIHGLWSPDLVAAARACRRAGIPYVWQPHGMLMQRAMNHKPLKKRAFLALGLRSLLRDAAAFIFATREEMEGSVLPDGAAHGAAHVVPLPLTVPTDPGRIDSLGREGRRRFDLAPSDTAIVFAGRLHPVKRIEMTLEAFAIAARSRPDLRLLLLGRGDAEYTQSLRALAERLGVGVRVTFAGWVDGDDKWRALAAAAALVLNSRFENFGYVIAEALGIGTPVVVTENLAVASEVRAVDPGLVAAPNADALAGALLTLLGRADLPRLSGRARQWVADMLSPQTVAAQLADLYRTVCPAPTSSSTVGRQADTNPRDPEPHP